MGSPTVPWLHSPWRLGLGPLRRAWHLQTDKQGWWRAVFQREGETCHGSWHHLPTEKDVLKLPYIDLKLYNDSRNFHFSQQNALDVVSCIKLTLVQKNHCSTGWKKQLREVRSSFPFWVLYKALSGTISIATSCGMRWSFYHFFTVLTVKKAHNPNYNENKETGVEQNFTRELKTPKMMSHAFSYRQPDSMWSIHSSPYIPIQCHAMQCVIEFFVKRSLVKQ